MTQALRFTAIAVEQLGDKYAFGAETRLDDVDPKEFDCSELVEWAAAQVGVKIPDGSAAQRAWCEKHGTIISVTEASQIRGALLFMPGHVGISLGNGVTIEAAGGSAKKVIFGKASKFDVGARVPGMEY